MKTMKTMLVLVAMLLCLLGIGKVEAGVYTSTFTATCVTGSSPAAVSPFGSDMELLRVEYSSGNAGYGNSFILLFDTPTLYCQNVLNGQPSPLGSDFNTGGFSRWGYGQLITPPIILLSSPTTGAQGNSSGYGYIDFTDALGDGRPIKYNLVSFKNGIDAGTPITYVIRKRRTSPEH